MARKDEHGNYTISAGEVGSYLLCPESWRLRTEHRSRRAPQPEIGLGESLHQKWAADADEFSSLTFSAKLTIALTLVVLVAYEGSHLTAPQQLPLLTRLPGSFAEIVVVGSLLLSLLAVLFLISRRIPLSRKETGLAAHAAVVQIDGSAIQPGRDYVSKRQRLAGRPDAVTREKGICIPIERKPLAKKMRDRHVAQLLVYLRLIEEFEGARPPYGYLILGPKARRVKIENSPERQQWLQRYLDEMRAVLAGLPAKPDPHPSKCAKCDVRELCSAALPKTER